MIMLELDENQAAVLKLALMTIAHNNRVHAELKGPDSYAAAQVAAVAESVLEQFDVDQQ